jgi:MerR family regulatory protein
MRLRILILFMFALLTEQWLSIGQLSERLNVPVETLRYWRKRGYGPLGVRLSSGIRSPIRYKLSAVEAFEAEREQAAARCAAERRSAVAS